VWVSSIIVSTTNYKEEGKITLLTYICVFLLSGFTWLLMLFCIKKIGFQNNFLKIYEESNGEETFIGFTYM